MHFSLFNQISFKRLHELKVSDLDGGNKAHGTGKATVSEKGDVSKTVNPGFSFGLVQSFGPVNKEQTKQKSTVSAPTVPTPQFAFG